MCCNNCPRHCNVDRNNSTGFCGQSNTLKVAKADLFLWEEPIISGKNGSGAIFFSGCNLKCCFCQNYEISSNGFGKDISIKRLAEIFKELEEKGAHNINLVSPSHYAMQIIEAIKIYRPNIPIVYNSNGYDSVDTLKSLKDYIDIYLVDYKYYDNALALKYSNVSDYFEIVTQAILEMTQQKPEIVVENGLMKSGVIIRHMVLPTHSDDSIKILKWISDRVKNKCLLSLLSQYTPVYKAKNYLEINRKIKPVEYKYVLNKAILFGLDTGFAQEFESSSENFIPIWDLKGV